MESIHRVSLSLRLFLCLLSFSLPAASWAGGADKLDSLLEDYSAISQGLHAAQQAQAALLERKDALVAQGANLSARQQGLNAETEVHSSVAAQEQKELDARKNECDKVGALGGKGAPQHPSGCGKASKKLGKMTLAANVGGKLEESQQTLLDLEWGQYTQAVTDWNGQESQNIAALNALYRSLNDWADRADYYMGSTPFLEALQASHADKACAHRKLPDGTLSMEALEHYTSAAERCLRYVVVRHRPQA